MTITESWVITAPRTIEIAGANSVVVQLNDGDIEVVGEPGRTGAELQVTEISDRPLQVSRADDRLRIGYDFVGIGGLIDRVRVLTDKDRVVARLVVPESADVRVTTARAAVTVTGLHSGVSVTTGSGGVRLDGVRGGAQLKTASGGVDARGLVGDLRVTTGTGGIKASGRLGRVTVQSVSGGVELRAEDSTPLIEARTVSGDVAVRLDPGTPVNLRARGASGKVTLDDVDLTMTGHTVSVDHADDDARAGAYVSTNVVSGSVAITR